MEIKKNKRTCQYDRIIIGAGLYGLYAALFCGKKGQSVLVIEKDEAAFGRATYINQARVHQGYHYPRSLSTAIKSAGYFEKFNRDYAFCVNKEFEKIYATSSKLSWTNGIQFKKFCYAAGIPCEELNPKTYFKDGMCDGAFQTREYTYDAMILKKYLLNEISDYSNIEIKYGMNIKRIEHDDDFYFIYTDECKFASKFVLNATYASTNQILEMARFEHFKIKYEKCEIILCQPNDALKNYGITVMDGPFFSIMPFGKTGVHSLTSVTFTPHETCYDLLPEFACQKNNMEYCSKEELGNCNYCDSKPKSAFPYMNNLAKNYLHEKFDYTYIQSLYSMKPILMSSEVDDSRPTVVRVYSKNPTFVGVLSGKINTVYDLDEVLSDEQ